MIMNQRRAQLIGLSVRALLTGADPLCFRLEGVKAAVPVARGGGLNDAVLHYENALQLLVDLDTQTLLRMDDVPGLPTHPRAILDLRDSVRQRFNILTKDTTTRYALVTQPASRIVQDSLAALACTLDSHTYALFRQRYLQARLEGHAEWDAFSCVLFSLFPLAPVSSMHVDPDEEVAALWQLVRDVGDTHLPSDLRALIPPRPYTTRAHELLQRVQALKAPPLLHTVDAVEAIVRQLHVQFEDYRIYKYRKNLVEPVLEVLVHLCCMLGKNDWLEYYQPHLDFDLSDPEKGKEEEKGKRKKKDRVRHPAIVGWKP